MYSSSSSKTTIVLLVDIRFAASMSWVLSVGFEYFVFIVLLFFVVCFVLWVYFTTCFVPSTMYMPRLRPCSAWVAVTLVRMVCPLSVYTLTVVSKFSVIALMFVVLSVGMSRRAAACEESSVAFI